jgi:Ca2+/Na+ antiporter
VWIAACQLIDALISRIEFRKWSHYCIAESVVLYLLSLFISRMFFWKGMDVFIFVSFTVIFLFTDGFIFWYFRKRQEIQAEEINELIRAREENGPDCARNF